MLKIREIEEEDLLPAMELKVACWTEELAGRAKNTLSAEAECEAWADWMAEADAYTDVRVTLGAYRDDRLVGVAAASFAEEDDLPEEALELNGLWVDAGARGQGLSLRLLDALLAIYTPLDCRGIVVYNCHHAASNAYYRKLGFRVLRSEEQKVNGQPLPVDVFYGGEAVIAAIRAKAAAL